MGAMLQLFGTSGCHLCEEAEQVISRCLAGAARGFGVELIDIADSTELTQRYGVRIPVLRCPASGAELGWPFDEAALQTFLGDL